MIVTPSQKVTFSYTVDVERILYLRNVSTESFNPDYRGSHGSQLVSTLTLWIFLSLFSYIFSTVTFDYTFTFSKESLLLKGNYPTYKTPQLYVWNVLGNGVRFPDS